MIKKKKNNKFSFMSTLLINILNTLIIHTLNISNDVARQLKAKHKSMKSNSTKTAQTNNPEFHKI